MAHKGRKCNILDPLKLNVPWQFPLFYFFIIGGDCRHFRRRQWHPTPVLLPGKSHGWRSLEGCSSCGRWGLDTTKRLHFHFSLSCTGEGNGNPLQCSCLENPRDGGAWWAAVYGVDRVRYDWSDLAAAAPVDTFCEKGPDQLSLFSLNNFSWKASVYYKYNHQINYQCYSSRSITMCNALKPSSRV